MSTTDLDRKRIGPKLLLFVGVLAMLVAGTPPLRAQSYSVLYSFCSQPDCADGSGPTGNLFLDAQGNLYGATQFGGAHQYGTLFKLIPNSTGTETVLHSFGAGVGSYPEGSLISDRKGNLYGTTVGSSSIFYDPIYLGSVFEQEKGNFRFLYRFYRNPQTGAVPATGLVMDAQGTLYGTTVFGGFSPCGGYGCGTLFKLTQDGTYSVLYSFAGGLDGESPNGGMVLDSQGNLFGTTDLGGGLGTGCGGIRNAFCGTAFKLSPDGTETILYSFSGGADGRNPNGGLVMDSQGNLYGTTVVGGTTSSDCPIGCGTVFKLTPSGIETVLHSFAGGTDGALPFVGLVMDSEGNLYGTTGAGGSGCGMDGGCGTVFKVTPGGDETILYRFTGGADGALPYGDLVLDAKGNLYGTTYAGGVDKCSQDEIPPGCGVVFKLSPSQGSFLRSEAR